MVWVQGSLEVGGEVHGQLLDGSVVVLLQLLQDRHITGVHEVDRNTLAAVPPGATDTVEVVLLVGRQVEVDHDRHVVHVDTARQQVGRDQHTGRPGAEGRHHLLTVALGHLGVHEAHREVLRVHLLRQPVHLAASVAEDHGLRDRHTVVQVHQRLQLELLLHRHVELLDTLQGQRLLLHQDTDRVTHELPGQLQHLRGHRRREQGHLHVLRQELEDLVDLLREPLRKHLVRLVQHQALQRVGAQGTTLDHVEHTPGGTHRHEHARLQLPQIVRHTGTAHEGVAERPVAQVLTDRRHHLLRLRRQLASRRQHHTLAVTLRPLHTLQQPDRERTSLSSPRLRLRDQVTALDEGDDRTLLDRRRLLETVRVDTTEQVGVQRHLVEGRAHLHVLRKHRILEGVVVLRLGLRRGTRHFLSVLLMSIVLMPIKYRNC
eukprot:Hpha_TRINITY_DN16942_c0_g1::TRINITY_DN16942_c0_g1_i4::g.55631::m.55631